MRVLNADTLILKEVSDGIYLIDKDAILNSPTFEAEPIRYAHWTDDHKCSACGGEAFSETVNIRPEYDYDWDENLVFTGSYEYDIEYHETDWCPFCGAKMDVEVYE